MKYKKKCKYCNKKFTAKRSDTKYCKDKCRMAANYERRLKEHGSTTNN